MEMDTQTAPDPFNLAGLIINQDYLQMAGTTRLLTTVKVGKPNRQDFFRINPDPTYRANLGILEDKEDRVFYIVPPGMTQIIPGEFYAATVFVGVNREGVPFVWPIRLPEPKQRFADWPTAVIFGLNSWSECLRRLRLSGYRGP
jgi:hypothetical protein